MIFDDPGLVRSSRTLPAIEKWERQFSAAILPNQLSVTELYQLRAGDASHGSSAALREPEAAIARRQLSATSALTIFA
jgi:hypothetical protein